MVDWLQRFIDELLICLHGCGAADLAELREGGVTPTCVHVALTPNAHKPPVAAPTSSWPRMRCEITAVMPSSRIVTP